MIKKIPAQLLENGVFSHTIPGQNNYTKSPLDPITNKPVWSSTNVDYEETLPTNITDVKSSVTNVNQDEGENNNHHNDNNNNDNDNETGFLPVLKNTNFLALWGGQIFSQLADKVYLVLVITIIAHTFQAEDNTVSGWVSAIMIAFTIPAVLFGSLAGVFIDRWSKKLVMVITNFLRGGLVLTMPLLILITKNSAPLYGLPLGFCMILGVTFLISTLTQFFAPAEQSAMPLIVAQKNLLSANSLYTMTMMGSVIIGFAVGQPVLEIASNLAVKIGVSPDLGQEFFVGGSYILAGIILIFIRAKENLNNPHEAPHILDDLKDGLSYLKKQSKVRNAIIQLIILFSIFAALSVLAVRLAAILPIIKAEQFGFLMASGGLGMALGATILGNFGEKFTQTKLSLFGSLGVAVCLFCLGIFTQSLWFSLSLTMMMGICGAFVAVPMQTTIQSETPDQMRGKVFGLQNNVINIALSLPLALAGVAETVFGLRNVFIGLSIIAISGGVLTWYINRLDN